MLVERLRLEAEEAAVDPVLGARLLDEAGDPVAVELGDAPLEVRDGPRSPSPAPRPPGARRAAPPGRRRRPRRRRSRRRSRPPSRSPSAAIRPPVGVSSPVSTHSTETGAGQPPRRRTARSARRGSRSRAGSDRSPAPRRSRSRARGSAARRSRPAASAPTRSSPAAACHGRRRGSPQVVSRRHPYSGVPKVKLSRPPPPGKIVTSSPSLMLVSRPCWKRMSSPET